MITINYGTDITQATYEALKASDILTYLKPHFKVAIKPNLVLADPATNGATTHPQVVEGLVQFLKDFGVSNIKIMESASIGVSTVRAFSVCGYDSINKKYDVPLVCLKNDPTTKLEYKGLEININNQALDTDFLINVPVLKAHCQTKLTCNMKNLKGCITDTEKRRYHTIGLHKPIAALTALIKTGYCVIDGICGDLTFEEGGNPTYANRIITGRDPVMLDSFCAEQIGYSPMDIGYLEYAKEWGLGEFYTPETIVNELNADKKPALSKKASPIAERYAKYINENNACSVCYATAVHALYRCGGYVGKIYVGQGFKGKSEAGLGIGNCTSSFKNYVQGCPPKATDIIKSL